MAGILTPARKDDAADASAFLSRVGYVVLALAAPAGVALHPLAIFVLFPIGVALLCLGALLDPSADFGPRLFRALTSPVALLGLAALAWASLSLLWTPFPIAAGQHLLKLGAWGFAILLALCVPREHARATDLYLFPIGVVLLMAVILIVWLASRQGALIDQSRILDGGIVLAVLLFPVMGGLAARGRNGYARLLLILAFIYSFAIGSTPTLIALFVGFAALSFALSDQKRTAQDLSWVAATLILLAPGLSILAEGLVRWIMRAKLPSLPAPYSSLAEATTVVTRDTYRLITGHGLETVARGVHYGDLPPQTPHSLLFQLWYELGIVGALIAAAAAWFGFRAIGRSPPRLAPYLSASLACNLTLAVLSCDLSDMTWFTTLAIAIIAADVAARSQYRTTRPSAAHLAHF
jgi:hypothetical protein